MRVAVIGAGVVGSAVALALARRGAEVEVVDPGTDPGTLGATPGSLAWINAHLSGSDWYFRLRVRAMALWRVWAAGMPGLPVRFAGALDWEVPEAELAETARRHQALGAATRVIGGAEIARLAPALAAPHAALWAPDDGMAEPDGIAAAFLAASGARVRRARVVEIAEGGGRLGLAEGTLTADHTVLAAGLGAVPLLAALGIRLPLEPSPGLIVETEPVGVRLAPLVATEKVHFWQRANGALLAGADYAGSYRAGAEEETVAEIVATLAALLPTAGPIRAAERRITDRPIPEDGLPILGPVPGQDRLSVAVMHSGVTLAPAVAEALAERIMGHDAERTGGEGGDLDLSPAALSRFAEPTPPRDARSSGRSGHSRPGSGAS